MESSIIDIRKHFANSEILTGKLTKVDDLRVDSRILYRCCKYETFLCFLLYDFKNIWLCQQPLPQVLKLNKEVNPSLEFNDINVLINFILDSIIRVESDLTIYQENNFFHFEVLVDIIKVKWIFQCEKLEIQLLLCTGFVCKAVGQLTFFFSEFPDFRERYSRQSV